MKKAMFVVIFAMACSLVNGQHNLIKRLDSIMDGYANLNWNAVVVVGKPGEVLYQRAIGYADVEKKVPLTADALLATASTGKMFTSTRIMQLVQQQKLDLNTPVKNFLSDWNIPNLDKITLHHLLTHTSGLGSPWDHPKYDFKKYYTPDETKKIIEEVPLVFQTPGERRHYSNTGYILLQKIIERTDGTSFEESMKHNILTPAGIFPRIGDEKAKSLLALPYYQVASNKFIKDEEMLTKSVHAGSGAGGWVLSAMDLFKFMEAYSSGKYLKPEMQTIQLTANGTYKGVESNYRYGMSPLPRSFQKPRLVIGHNGGGKGTSADAYYDVESGYIVAMVSNQFATGYAITGNLFKALFNEPLVMPSHASEVRVVDHIISKGSESLTKNPDSFFAEIKLKPSELLFEMVYNNLKLMGDYHSAAALMAAGRKLFPEAADIFLYSGEIALHVKDKKMAQEFYLEAKRIAEEKKHTLLVNYVTAKLKEMEQQATQ